MSTLRFGILGAARIARGFAHSLRGEAAAAAGVAVVAVASRDRARAAAFAAEFGVARVHDDYDALLADRDVDAVYVALPAAHHAAWTVRAARAGKHVLCEKPLATSAADARAMFAAAAAAGVRLLEAFPYRAQPQTLAARRLVRDGAIGAPRVVQAAFGFLIADAGDIRFDPALGGGALYDGGCYPVSFVRMIAGRAARRASATAVWSPSGVDVSLAGTLEFDGGLVAQIACSMATALHRRAVVAGDGGTLETGFYNHPPADLATVAVRRGLARDYHAETIATGAVDGFVAEAAVLRAMIAGADRDADAWEGMTAAESIDTAAMIDALYASARAGGAPRDVAAA